MIHKIRTKNPQLTKGLETFQVVEIAGFLNHQILRKTGCGRVSASCSWRLVSETSRGNIISFLNVCLPYRDPNELNIEMGTFG